MYRADGLQKRYSQYLLPNIYENRRAGLSKRNRNATIIWLITLVRPFRLGKTSILLTVFLAIPSEDPLVFESVGSFLLHDPSKPTSLSRISLLWGDKQIGKDWASQTT